MKVTCPSCEWSAEVPDEKIPAKGGKGTCPKCQTKFEVKREEAPPPDFAFEPSKPENSKPCPFCGEQILADAKKCKHCGEFLDPLLIKARNEAAPQPHVISTDESIVRKIADYQNLSGILWIILGIIQCIGVVTIIAGVWNIYAGISRRKIVKPILSRSSAVLPGFESLTGIIIIGVINLVLGGVIGVVFVVFDYIIRGKVLDNRHLFNDCQPEHSTPNIQQPNAPIQSNPSGNGSPSISAVPDGVKGWCWGAFTLGFVWAIAHKVWLGLLTLVPIVNIVMIFVLGFKGREWAWKAKQWDSVEQFNRVQKRWSQVGVTLLVGGLLLAIVIPQFVAYRNKGLNSLALSDLKNTKTCLEAYHANNSIFPTSLEAAKCQAESPTVTLEYTQIDDDKKYLLTSSNEKSDRMYATSGNDSQIYYRLKSEPEDAYRPY